MQTATISFDRFNALADEDAQAAHPRRARQARQARRAARPSLPARRRLSHADLTGDSLKLSRLAAQTDAEYIVFCGVHFMAEVADILSRPEQISILPDLAAGCSMADMASLAKVERAWRELARVLDPDEQVTPVTYINSAADLKAFCGEHGGIVCTSSATRRRSSNGRSPGARRCCSSPTSISAAGAATRWASRWTRWWSGIPTSNMGGLTPEQIRSAKILLWKGHCSVHQMFQPQHILRFRNQYPDGMVISHPECELRGLQAVRLRRLHRIHHQDHQGSARRTRAGWSAPSSTWSNRLAEEVKPEGKIVQFMAPTVCMCSTMPRIDPQHLAWCLENLAEGKVVNRISVPEHEAELAKIALERMLEVS